ASGSGGPPRAPRDEPRLTRRDHSLSPSGIPLLRSLAATAAPRLPHPARQAYCAIPFRLVIAPGSPIEREDLMKTTRRLLSGLTVSVLLPTAAMAQKVAYDYKHNGDFRNLKTFAFRDVLTVPYGTPAGTPNGAPKGSPHGTPRGTPSG